MDAPPGSGGVVHIQRKLQVAAALVVVNAFAALNLMAPREARASTCQFAACLSVCPTLSTCQQAHPECTATDVICHNIGGAGCPLSRPFFVRCIYN
jgi:hypothetical protein